MRKFVLRKRALDTEVLEYFCFGLQELKGVAPDTVFESPFQSLDHEDLVMYDDQQSIRDLGEQFNYPLDQMQVWDGGDHVIFEVAAIEVDDMNRRSVVEERAT